MNKVTESVFLIFTKKVIFLLEFDKDYIFWFVSIY
jgi:hypothetical protein